MTVVAILKTLYQDRTASCIMIIEILQFYNCLSTIFFFGKVDMIHFRILYDFENFKIQQIVSEDYSAHDETQNYCNNVPKENLSHIQ